MDLIKLKETLYSLNLPAFRYRQIVKNYYSGRYLNFDQMTDLSLDLRQKLSESLKLLSVSEKNIVGDDSTQKVLLELSDGQKIESVFMNYEDWLTVCVSSQVGCSLGCHFCATGKMGFKRNLTAQEMIDEVRFWMKDYKISNIVLMGQGEPFLNYENVKQALNIILKYAEMGPRQITVSTVGVPVVMEKMVEDKDWPSVRFALSLHNPIEEERKKLIPSHQKDFLKFLIDWSKKYHERFSSRTQFIGLEYTLVPGENDSERHLKALIKLASKLGKVRINLIPLNESKVHKVVKSIKSDAIEYWHKRLMECGFTTTIRRSQGQDIAAACGQLALNTIE